MSKLEEIEKKYNAWWEWEHTMVEPLLPDINWLISELKITQEDAKQWQQNFEDERHAYHDMWKRVVELEASIKKHQNWIGIASPHDVELYAVLEQSVANDKTVPNATVKPRK